MEKEKEEIVKPSYSNRFSYRNGSYITVKWRAADGDERDFDNEDVQKTILSLFGKRLTAPGITGATHDLKTVFLGYPEKELIIELGKSGELKQRVKYQNGEITEYMHLVDLGDKKYKARYIKVEGEKQDNVLSFLGRSQNMLYGDEKEYEYGYEDEYEDEEAVLYHPELSEMIETEAKCFDLLSRIKGSSTLSEGEERLCRTYFLFFGETPDFRDPETAVKACAMDGILKGADIDIGFDFDTFVNFDQELHSFGITCISNDLRSLGKINGTLIDTPFESDVEGQIADVGKIVSEWTELSSGNDITVLGTYMYRKAKDLFDEVTPDSDLLKSLDTEKCLAKINKITEKEQ